VTQSPAAQSKLDFRYFALRGIAPIFSGMPAGANGRFEVNG